MQILATNTCVNLPLMMLRRGAIMMPMQQYGMRISQKSWLNSFRLGRPWKTRPLSGNRIRTVLNVWLKRAVFRNRTRRKKWAMQRFWHQKSLSVSSIKTIRRQSPCAGPTMPVKNRFQNQIITELLLLMIYLENLKLHDI